MNVIYSNGIIIFDFSYEEDTGEAPELSIKAGELYELAKHNIILLRWEFREPDDDHYCYPLTAFLSGEGTWGFWFNTDIFRADSADDYPRRS